MKVLVVEDEIRLRKEIIAYLSDSQVICEEAASLGEAFEKLGSFNYDIVLLDLMLPEGTGLDLIKKIKELNVRSAILIISAKDSLDDKLSGLYLGADDYLAKPFHLAELRARVIALYRRMNFEGKNEVVFEEIVIDLLTKEV
ncbi:MAG: response regulator transcription factor, partial [Bacteroidota bacterium]